MRPPPARRPHRPRAPHGSRPRCHRCRRRARLRSLDAGEEMCDGVVRLPEMRMTSLPTNWSSRRPSPEAKAPLRGGPRRAIARGVLDWAPETPPTHFSQCFQPGTGPRPSASEVGLRFFSSHRQPVPPRCSTSQTDEASDPSGGMRSGFEARRVYTAGILGVSSWSGRAAPRCHSQHRRDLPRRCRGQEGTKLRRSTVGQQCGAALRAPGVHRRPARHALGGHRARDTSRPRLGPSGRPPQCSAARCSVRRPPRCPRSMLDYFGAIPFSALSFMNAWSTRRVPCREQPASHAARNEVAPAQSRPRGGAWASARTQPTTTDLARGV